MSGLEVLAAVAAAAQLGDAALKLASSLPELVSQFRDAPLDIDEQKSYLQQIHDISILIQCQAFLQVPPIPEILESILKDVRSLQEKVMNVVPEKEKRITRLLGLASWLSKKRQILILFTKLEQKENLLILCIITLNSTQSHSTSDEITDIRGKLEDISLKLQAINDNSTNATKLLSNSCFAADKLGGLCLHGEVESLLNQAQLPHCKISGPPKKLTDRDPTEDLSSHIELKAQKAQSQINNGSDQGLKLDTAVSHFPSTWVTDFVGRQDLLDRIDRLLVCSKTSGTIVVLFGMGGSGKTQLASKYCRLKSAQGFSIFWVDAINEDHAKQSYRALWSKLFRGASTTDASVDFDLILHSVQTQLQASPKHWIMVLDNLDDPSKFVTISNYIPNLETGLVIVTTREPDLTRLGEGIPVDGMCEQDALELLFKRIGPCIEKDKQQASSIVHRLGFLPLAIDQAACYIRKQNLPLCEFIDHYEDRRKHILQYMPTVWEYKKVSNFNDEESGLSVFTAWELTYQRLQAAGMAREAKLINISGFLNHNSISEDIFQKNWERNTCSEKKLDTRHNKSNTILKEIRIPGEPGRVDDDMNSGEAWDSSAFRSAIAELHDLFLVQQFSQSGNKPCKFSMHPLVSDWIKLRIQSEARRCSYAGEAIQIITSSIDSSTSTMGPDTNQEILAHMDECLKNEGILPAEADEFDVHAINHPAASFGKFYLDQGRYGSAKTLFERALKHFDQRHEYRSPERFQILHCLGQVCHKLGYHSQAENHYLQALKGRTTILGADHHETLITLQEIANIRCSQGNYQKAEELYEQVVRKLSVLSGGSHPETLKAISRLADNHRSLGKYLDAELLYQQALSGLEASLGVSNLDTLKVVDDFGNNYQRQGRHKEAESLYRRALEGREMLLGLDHPDTLWTIANLANNYRTQKRYDEAESLYNRALDSNKSQLGCDHPETLWIMDGLAMVYHAQKRYKAAEHLFEEVLSGRKMKLGPNHLNTIRTLNNLANVYQSQNRFSEAEELLKMCLEIRRHRLGLSHPKTQETLESLNKIYHAPT